MPANDWEIGALYPLGIGQNNVKWAQPGGVGTLVYPTQIVGGGYFSTEPFSELTGIFRVGCGHSVNYALLQQEYDYETKSSCILCLCPLCGYTQSAIEPASAALSTTEYPWIVI